MRKITKREEEYYMEDMVAVKLPGHRLGVGDKEELRTQRTKAGQLKGPLLALKACKTAWLCIKGPIQGFLPGETGVLSHKKGKTSCSQRETRRQRANPQELRDLMLGRGFIRETGDAQNYECC